MPALTGTLDDVTGSPIGELPSLRVTVRAPSRRASLADPARLVASVPVPVQVSPGGEISVDLEPGPAIMIVEGLGLRDVYELGVTADMTLLSEALAEVAPDRSWVESQLVRLRGEAVAAADAAVDARDATVAAEARVGVEHDHVHADVDHVDSVAAQVAAALDQANVFAQDQVPPYLQQPALNATYGPKNVQPMAPTVTVYPHLSDPLKRVMWQDGATLYAVEQTNAGMVHKSTDHGATWGQRGEAGMPIRGLFRAASGTLLAVEQTASDSVDVTRLLRSTDDGATWSHVFTMRAAVLGPNSFTQTPTGAMLIAEYGNVGNTVYRLLRSTDDGATWTPVLSSPGTDQASDPGHIHSVARDHVNGKLIAFMDRQHPELFQSDDDDGATWTRIAISHQDGHPNWVAPMIFENYIAWGVDNWELGHIYRLPRSDFYAGNWEEPELVAVVNRVAFYSVFEVRPGVWLLSAATEQIGGDPEGVQSYANQVYVVDQDGARVSGGLSQQSPNTDTNAVLGQKIEFPGAPASRPHQKGRVWAAFPASAIPYPFSSAPLSVGDLPMPTVAPYSGFITPPMLNNGNDAGLFVKTASGKIGEARAILGMDSAGNASFRNRGTWVRIDDNGVGRLMSSGATRLAWSDGGVDIERQRINLYNYLSGPSIFTGLASPNGNVSARIGSLYFHDTAPPRIFEKSDGSTNTGWRSLSQTVGPSSSRPTDAAVGDQHFDTTLGKPVWLKTAPSTWVDATGTVV